MTFDELFKKATGSSPFEYQRVFARAEALPDLLEAPTGVGKTATAVLGWLWRRREHDRSEAFWIDLDLDDADACLPYEPPALRVARERLQRLSDVGPISLATVERDAEEPVAPVIRRKDLLELFDTEPDLAGHDIDVSRYVRTADERDVQVAWRPLGTHGPAADASDLHRAFVQRPR